MVIFHSYVNLPEGNKPQTAVWLGGVPFKYQIVMIGGVPPQIIDHGLLIRGWHSY